MKNILIVDDSSTARCIIQKCLQIAGISDGNFLDAQNGVEALKQLDENNQIDLIITDIKMPLMDGITLVNKIKSNEKIKNIPIIIVSSIGDSKSDEELVQIGVQYFIKKPVNPEKLFKVLGEING